MAQPVAAEAAAAASAATATAANPAPAAPTATATRPTRRLPEQYQGEFLDDLRHGKGTCNFSDGAVYTGEW